MDIRIIVFGMCFVLVGLFLGAKFFVPKEKDKSKKEAQFAGVAKTFLQTPNQENFDQCFKAAKELPHLRGKADDEVNAFLSKSGIRL